MAATVVTVVIFLCGVLVGRGVRAERGVAIGDSAALVTENAEPIAPPPASPPPATPAGSDPTKAAPPPAPADDELSYFNRLEKTGPSDDLKAKEKHPAAEKANPAPKPAAEARNTPPPAPA